MKTAAETNRIAKEALLKKAKAIMDLLERCIERESQKGMFECSVPIDINHFGVNSSIINYIVGELDNNRYKVTTKTTADQRDGSYVTFNISWR